jgi:hypothetical protein
MSFCLFPAVVGVMFFPVPPERRYLEDTLVTVHAIRLSDAF